MSASIGDAIDPAVANLAPILDTQALPLGPTLNTVDVPDLPPELQPAPGDVLLASPIWPWEDLGAQGIPEHWLYMSRRVQGTVSLMSVQTSQGPKLARANPDGTLIAYSQFGGSSIPMFQIDPAGTQGYPQRMYSKGAQLDAVNIAAAGTAQIFGPPGNAQYIIKKFCLSSNVGVTNKIHLLSDNFVFFTAILPPNHPPLVYEYPDYGNILQAVNNVRLFSDNAGIFCFDVDYLVETPQVTNIGGVR